jgi:hypothetical protein
VQSAEAARVQYAQATAQAAQLAGASLLASFPNSQTSRPISCKQQSKSLVPVTQPAHKPSMCSWSGSRLSPLPRSRFSKCICNVSSNVPPPSSSWVAEQDAIFEREVAVKETPERMKEITQNVVELAREYGVSGEELAAAWQSQPVLRSAAFQRIMVDAAKYRMAQKQIVNKGAARPVPPVQRPGVSQPRSGDDGVARALKAFSNDPSPKAAADLLMARRAARR